MLALHWESHACQRGENNWEQGGRKSRPTLSFNRITGMSTEWQLDNKKACQILYLAKYEYFKTMPKIQLCNFAWNTAASIFSSRRLCLRRGDVAKNGRHQKIWLCAVCAMTGSYKSVEVLSLLTALQMPHSCVAAVNIGSIIKGLSLPCSPSSLHSANACICNVPEDALSPPATWIHRQPPVHGKALIWRQASRVPRWAAEKSDVLPPVLISSTHTQLASSSPAHPDCGNKCETL